MKMVYLHVTCSGSEERENEFLILLFNFKKPLKSVDLNSFVLCRCGAATTFLLLVASRRVITNDCKHLLSAYSLVLEKFKINTTILLTTAQLVCNQSQMLPEGHLVISKTPLNSKSNDNLSVNSSKRKLATQHVYVKLFDFIDEFSMWNF